jgi:drug/metabolite transporter (DMT)-like permease
MVFLVLSFLCSALLILLFKVFEKTGTPVFQAIVFNYCTAATCGFIFLPNHQTITSGAFIQQGWLPVAWVLGIMFIVVFNLTSLTAISFGVSTASVASKLGLVLPVILAFVLYKEPFNYYKLAGILLAFAAVILSSVKEKPADPEHHKKLALLPFLVFIGNGLCDSVTQFANKRYLAQHGTPEFAMFIFVAAGATGIIILIAQIARKKTRLNFKSLAGGIALGIPNYFSFLFLLKALASLNWGSSVIFPVANLGTVVCATLGGLIIFKEKISAVNWWGLALALGAILIITLFA